MMAKQLVYSNTIQDITLAHPYADKYLLKQGNILTVTGFGLTELGNKVLLTPMGVLAPGSAKARPSARPPST